MAVGGQVKIRISAEMTFEFTIIMLSYLRPLSKPLFHQTTRRPFHSVQVLRRSTFTNLLASDNPPPVQVSSITPSGILLADGLIIPSACIFLEGKVFLWDVPENIWEGWTKDHFEIFEAVVPKPGRYISQTLRKRVSDIFYRNPALWDWADNGIATSIFAFVYERDWHSSRFHGHGTHGLTSLFFHPNITTYAAECMFNL